jgi:hypothetical protein
MLSAGKLLLQKRWQPTLAASATDVAALTLLHVDTENLSATESGVNRYLTVGGGVGLDGMTLCLLNGVDVPVD